MATKKESKKQTTAKETSRKASKETSVTNQKDIQDTPKEPSKKDPPLQNHRGFAKGHKKVGGRQLGTKNKYGNVRDRLKEKIDPFLDNLDELIQRAIKEDGAAAGLAAIEKFMPYFTPKFSSVSLGAEQDRPLSEEEALMDMDAKYKKKELEINIKSLTIVNNDIPHDDVNDTDEQDFDFSKLEDVE